MYFRQTEEMNKAVDRLEDDMTEAQINKIAARHFEDQTFLQVQLTSELETIKEAQRREYREWLMQMLEQNQTNSSLPTPKLVYNFLLIAVKKNTFSELLHWHLYLHNTLHLFHKTIEKSCNQLFWKRVLPYIWDLN